MPAFPGCCAHSTLHTTFVSIPFFMSMMDSKRWRRNGLGSNLSVLYYCNSVAAICCCISVVIPSHESQYCNRRLNTCHSTVLGKMMNVISLFSWKPLKQLLAFCSELWLKMRRLFSRTTSWEPYKHALSIVYGSDGFKLFFLQSKVAWF